MLEIKVPAIGGSIRNVILGKYYKKEGDTVQKDEIIAEFESVNTVFKLSVPVAGTIKKLNAKEGDSIAVGAVMCTLETTIRMENEQAAHSKSTDWGSRGMHVERMSTLRKSISKRLVTVTNETAMLTTFNEVDMKPILDLRAKYKDLFKEKHGVRLGFMSFFTKACCDALLAFPTINSQLNDDHIFYYNYCDISVAVSTEKGLLVPVMRNAQNKTMHEIEKEILNLAGKARDGKLTIDEMTGGTFTITNGGGFGSMLSTPIINAPQSAILGMHNIVERAVVRDGKIIIRPIMYIALSYDHRIIDGKDGVGFLVRVKQILENPKYDVLDL